MAKIEDTVRFMAAVPLKVPLRRKHPRYQLTSPVEVTVLRSGIPQSLPGRLVDAGVGGLSVVLAGDLYIGESVGIEFALADSSELLQARARVRYQDRIRCGLEFATLNPGKLELVRQWAQNGRPVMVSEADTAKFVPVAPELKFLTTRTSRRRQPRRRASWLALKVTLGVLATALAVGGMWASSHPRKFRQFMASITAPSPVAATPAAPEAPPQRMIVAADVMQSLISYRTMPVYPDAARQKDIEGGVLLDTVIGKDGRVLDVQLISGPPELATAAMDAVKNWRFRPFTLNASAVEVETTIEVAFKLN